MDLLLDTHILLWATIAPERLPEGAADLIDDHRNTIVASVVSLWEIAIKSGLRRPGFGLDPHALRRSLPSHGYRELAITAKHALAVANLPPIHRDPFDRMLVGQSLSEGITLLTADPVVGRYPGPIRLMPR